jgi:hypothetical protein
MAYIGKNPRLKSIVSQGDTLANLTAEPRVAGRLVYATDEAKFYYDDGTTLNVVGSGEGGGGGGVPLLSKGGLITSDGSNNGELAVGTDGQILVVDDSEVSGLKWIDPPTGGGADPESEGFVYLGDRNTNGSWRFIVNSGALNIEVRVAGVWVTKDTVNP